MQIVEKQRCSQCGQHQDALVRFDRGGPYCKNCIRDAWIVLRDREPKLTRSDIALINRREPAFFDPFMDVANDRDVKS